MGRLNKVTTQHSKGKIKKPEKKSVQPSKRKNAPASISFNESFFRALIEHNSNAITLLNSEGAVIYDSPAATGLLGYSPTEWIGKSVFELVHQDDLQTIQATFQNLLKPKSKPANATFRLRRKDNSWMWIDAVATNLLAEPSVQAIVVNYRDITQHKNAEDSLIESEERFREVWETTSDAMVLSDAEGIVLAANPAYYNLYGYKPEQVLGQSFTIIFAEDFREYALKSYKEIFKSDVPPKLLETVVMRADGVERIVESSASFLTSAGQRTSMLSTIRDITDRKQAQEALREIESRYHYILDTMMEGCQIIGFDWRYIYVNEVVAKQQAHLKPEEMLNRKVMEIYPGVESTELFATLRLCMEERVPTQMQTQFIFPDGRMGWFELSIQPAREGIFILSTDITERKQAEDTLASNEKNFRTLIENSSDWFAKINAEGAATYVSEPMTRSLGYSVEEFIGTKIFNLIHPEDISNTQNLFAKLIQDPTQVVSAEYRLKHKDGSWRWVESIGKNLLNDPDIRAIIGNFRDITERKQAEEIIRSERNFSNLALESLPGVFYMYDENRKFLRWNKNFEKVTGYTGDEIADMNPLDFFNEQEKLLVDEKIKETFHKGSSWVEANFVAKDGTHTPYYFTGRTFILEGKTCLIGTGIDITERRKAEKALLMSEEQYRSLFEDSPIALWVEDFSEAKKRLNELKQNGITDIPAYIREHPDFIKECSNIVKILDVNHAAVKLYHATDKSQLLGSLSTNSIPISPEQFEYELIQLANGRLHFEYEGIDQTLAGDKINVNIHWTVAPGYEADFSKIIVSTIDITKRKLAEDKLHKQNERLKALREIDISILAADTVENIVSAALSHIRELVNCQRASLALIDWEAGEGLIFNVSASNKLVLPKGTRVPLSLFQDMNKELAKNQSVLINDLTAIPNPPPLFQTGIQEGLRSICVLPLFSQNKLIGAFSLSSEIVSFFDEEKINLAGEVANQVAIAITQNGLINELQELNAKLEHRVAQRTVELNKTNLELEHANRAKDEFLANMSHELRTPLNSILGLSESMLEQYQDSLNENQQKSLQTIEASGTHLLDLINDILDLSKIEAGKFDYYPQPIRVDDLCKSSLIFVKTQATKKNITLSYENEEAISDFSADPRRLKQVLVNLLTNAVKFTPNDGHVTLKIKTNLEKDVIQFSVIDTGIGITQDDLRKLFTPFVQVESSLNRHFEGTGLGLALVSKLTDLHGGSVEVESEIGKGSRFTINLPYQRGNLNQTSEPEKFTPHARDIQIDFQPKKENKNKKILLVEDNAANILTIGEYLENYGYQIIIANDGLQAIEKAKEILPNIILMDIQMPKMDGLEATRRLRADPQFASVPIIALTALAMPGDRERCLEAGASEYMSKPVSLKELKNVIENFLNQK